MAAAATSEPRPFRPQWYRPTPCFVHHNATPQVIREKKMMKQDLDDILAMMFGGERCIILS